MRDWVAWHEPYADPASALSTWLCCVQQHLSQAIDQATVGPVQLASLCAGRAMT